MPHEELERKIEKKLVIAWDTIEKIGWFVLGAGCMKIGWFGPDNFFGSQWTALVIGAMTVAASWVFQPYEDKE